MNEITPFLNTTLEILMQNNQKDRAKSTPRFPKEVVQKTFHSELTCFCQCAAMVIENITFYGLTLNQKTGNKGYTVRTKTLETKSNAHKAAFPNV